MCAVSITFCNKPTIVSSTLCLSALNTKVTKTAQLAFFPLFFLCFPNYIELPPWYCRLYIFTDSHDLVQSHFCPVDPQLKNGISQPKVLLNLIKISFEFKLNATIPLYILSTAALCNHSYEVFTCFSYHTGYQRQNNFDGHIPYTDTQSTY